MTVTPEGWYPDPQDAALVRYWDGQAWTDHTAPAAPPAAPPPPAAPYGTQPGPFEGDGSQGDPSYPTYPVGQPGVPSPYVEEKPSNTLSIIAMVCGGVSVIFCPLLLGIAGLVLGGIAKSKKEPLANIALIVAGVGMVVGFIVSVVVLNSMGEI